MQVREMGNDSAFFGQPRCGSWVVARVHLGCRRRRHVNKRAHNLGVSTVTFILTRQRQASALSASPGPCLGPRSLSLPATDMISLTPKI
jgi:hypothetical protein